MDAPVIDPRKAFLSWLLTVYSLVVVIGLGFVYGSELYRAEWTYLPPAVAGAGLGRFLTWKRPENRIGLLLSTLVAGLVSLGASNILIPYTLEHGSSLSVVLGSIMSDAAFLAMFTCALVLLPLWFPTGQAISRRWAWVGPVAIVFASISFISFVLADSVCVDPDPEGGTCIEVAIPWGIEGFTGFESAMLVTFVAAIPAVGSSFVRWRRSEAVERQQIKWFLLSAVGFIVAFVLSTDLFKLERLYVDIAYSLAFAGIFFTITLAVLKYRLYEIDRIISRTVAYSIVVAVLASVFAAGVVLVPNQLLEGEAPPILVAASTLAVAALFNPVRRRVQDWVDHQFNRSRYDAVHVMDEFAGSLQDHLDPDGVVDGWVGVVEETMHPAAVGVWVRK